ncbi:unnamed protein product [Rodentolepis nana]|uniref:Protein FAR1-RELATED SEQUENCE n=1 Tax=Rodentolepis nana TaxID=102285 RepID=A0A0R3TX53_RODNA|nr:unnamed protein product [Rodentolepis nana]
MTTSEHLWSASSSSYTELLNKTEEFIAFLKDANQYVNDFEFDCHQAAQLYWHEAHETHLQTCGFLLDYENDIKLLAPHSAPVACALQILPYMQAENTPTMQSGVIYDYYNVRGRKMRLVVWKLPKALEDFHALIECLPGMISGDESCENPQAILHLYEKMYRNCLLFVKTPSSGVEGALATFFRHRHLIRRKLHLHHEDIVSSESTSDSSVYIVETDELTDTLSEESESESVPVN